MPPPKKKNNDCINRFAHRPFGKKFDDLTADTVQILKVKKSKVKVAA